MFIDGSYKQPGIGLPFGYIRVSSASAVQLLVMPYNYPDLLTLLAQAKEGPKVIASVPFQQRFDKYLNTVPSYYYSVELRTSFDQWDILGHLWFNEAFWDIFDQWGFLGHLLINVGFWDIF